jgi:hypothetical protein
MLKRIKGFASHGRRYLSLYQTYKKATGFTVPTSVLAKGFRPWRESLRPDRSPVHDRVPWITFGAYRHLSPTLPLRARVFEYGSGGSTLFFLDRGHEVTTVEHDADWLDRVRSQVTRHAPWSAHHEPPLPVDSDDDDCVSEFRGYAGLSFRHYVHVLDHFAPGHFDVVMVDGRARAACLAVASRLVAPDGTIILDNSERPRYAAAVALLQQNGWRPSDFHGPGPYVMTEFWNTTVFRRHDTHSEKS